MRRDETSPAEPREVWSSELEAAVPGTMNWLWHGYLGPGNVTLLTSQWKSGKTTLVSVLLARRAQGGQVAGRAVAAGKTAVVSEEALSQWKLRRRKLDWGDGVCFFCRPFRGKPSQEQWLGLLDRLAELHAERGVDLVVIDTLAALLPGSDENHAGQMMAGLLPLQRLTSRGMGVLLLHHPRKGEAPAGQMARGSGALAGYVDIVLEMDWYARGCDADRRRRLQGYSRYEETPRQLVLELSADGTDYLAHGLVEDSEFTGNWERLRMVLEDAAHKLTRREIQAQWPPDFVRPPEATLWRWLDKAVAQGLIHQEGTGRRNAPFRYWLPGMEEKWRADPFYLPDVDELLQEKAEQALKAHRAKWKKGRGGGKRQGPGGDRP